MLDRSRNNRQISLPRTGQPGQQNPASARPLYLLCGGGSRRMGRDKAMLPFGGGTLLEHQIEKCGDAFSEIVLLSGVRQYPVGLKHLPDAMEDAGPLSALLAALEDTASQYDPVALEDPSARQLSVRSSDTLAVMAIDLPEIEPATLQYLASMALPKGVDVLIAELEAHVGDKRDRQPLLGVYHRRVTSRLRNYLRDGHRSVLGFLGETRTATFRVTENEIRNVNTKAEFDRLVNRQ